MAAVAWKHFPIVLDRKPSRSMENPVVEWVQSKIGSVYRGTKHRDTAITELRVFTSTP